MKSLEQWLDDYSADHQNPINQKLHKIAVPIIFLSAHGLFFSLPMPLFLGIIIADSLALIFYFRLSRRSGFMMALIMMLQAIILMGLIYLIPTLCPLMAILFVLAWITQFYGHHLEGRKPSFLHDMGYLLIGPLWVAQSLFLHTECGNLVQKDNNKS